MPIAQLKFKLPDGPADLSTERPDGDFRVLATRATATSLRVVLEVLVCLDIGKFRGDFEGEYQFESSIDRPMPGR